MQQKNMDTLLTALDKNLDTQKEKISLYQRKQATVILKRFLDYLSEEQ